MSYRPLFGFYASFQQILLCFENWGGEQLFIAITSCLFETGWHWKKEAWNWYVLTYFYIKWSTKETSKIASDAIYSVGYTEYKNLIEELYSIPQNPKWPQIIVKDFKDNPKWDDLKEINTTKIELQNVVDLRDICANRWSNLHYEFMFCNFAQIVSNHS